MLIGGILFGTAHQALTCMCASHFPKIPRRRASTRQAKQVDAVRAALATLGSYTTTPTMRVCGDLGGLGERGAGSSSAASARFLIGRCCCSPALSRHSETHRLWLGTARRGRRTKNRTSCGRRIKPGAWPARSTRRSSSPWVVPGSVPGSGQSPAGRCPTGALRGTGSAVPRPCLAGVGASRISATDLERHVVRLRVVVPPHRHQA